MTSGSATLFPRWGLVAASPSPPPPASSLDWRKSDRGLLATSSSFICAHPIMRFRTSSPPPALPLNTASWIWEAPWSLTPRDSTSEIGSVCKALWPPSGSRFPLILTLVKPAAVHVSCPRQLPTPQGPQQRLCVQQNRGTGSSHRSATQHAKDPPPVQPWKDPSHCRCPHYRPRRGHTPTRPCKLACPQELWAKKWLAF